MNRREAGQKAEQLAEAFLLDKGLELCERNFTTRHGELDLVMRDGGTLVVVEVRSRSDEVDPALTVDRAKQTRIVRATVEYCRKRRLGRIPCRYDVVAVSTAPETAQIRHLEAAFQAAPGSAHLP